MKKFFYLIVIATLCVSCEIDQAGIGGIYGNWQLREVDTLATGGVCNMEKSAVYWAFESDVMQVRRIYTANLKMLFSYTMKGDSITVSDPMMVQTKDNLIPVEDKKVLEEFGFTDLKDVFHIRKQKGNSLVMENKKYRFVFRKY